VIVTYAPKDRDAQTWNYKADDFPALEAEDIEEESRLTFDEFNMKLIQGSMKCRRLLLWVLLRRDNAALGPRDVAFRTGEVTIEFDRAEKAKLRSEIAKLKDISESERAQALALLADEEPESEDPSPKG